MIDRADRTAPRFPAWAEDKAGDAIRASIASLAWMQSRTAIGIAGGACGGDLLFHECCQELGIATRVLLALPPDEFEAASVAPAGQGWVNRFRRLLERSGGRVHVMPSGRGLREDTHDLWARAALWMIDEAQHLAHECALLALWDGRAGNGPGGTEHFLKMAQERNIRILPWIDMQALLASEYHR